MKKNKDNQVSIEEDILIQYLMSFLPADGNEENIMLKSTQNIQDDLADMVEISLNQISSVMRDTGYKVKVDEDLLPKWMMLRK
ncbi:hypothetical protein [Bacteroides xylanisolvens]|jgi:hypothetical protein|uniref:hypothetical protein n=1 Tax=Bacteroides xylanisolvens TaxID=371601 RepID=UPI001C37A1B5|nr:hypothetical protein [Bacteroides xylanisolvens]MBV3619411.1 hypothetical protein [Bacteroides xylanisolvens]